MSFSGDHWPIGRESARYVFRTFTGYQIQKMKPNTSKFLWVPFLCSLFLYSCDLSESTPMSYDAYPVPENINLWPEYSSEATTFRLWSPPAEMVRLHLYDQGDGGSSIAIHELKSAEKGIWELRLPGDWNGTYYTFQIKVNGKWLAETPGIYAQAVGVNGHRAMVVDLEQTNPDGWSKDRGPELDRPSQAIIYELHIRDLTIHPESGSSYPGKYLGVVEPGTRNAQGVATGLDHLIEMGITHVHLLPTFDHYAIDETRLEEPQFNWGYDPQNYNVPEGSFSTDPFRAEVRIREFKEMVLGLHQAGIGVVLDVVYNHTGKTEDSNFNLEVPGYYYRHRPDGTFSDASACGNETASERAMMRHFIVESVAYWAREYHLDGFRFDLMGIHDQETMRLVYQRLQEINPNILVYGEGWAAGDSPLLEEERALKKYTYRMPGVQAFSDDLRDGLKGSVFDDTSRGFVSGAPETESSIQFGVVGSIWHPQIDYQQVNYSDTAWTQQPWQAVSYVSCHDNHTLIDKLRISQPEATQEEHTAMAKLANAIVLTSQGMPFLHAGTEFLRTKDGEHNSYNLPDSINQIDWSQKTIHSNVVSYYQNLISLRKAHPGFYLPTAELVREHLRFQTVAPGLVSYRLDDLSKWDTWTSIYVIYNARSEAVSYQLPGEWRLAVRGDRFDLENGANGKRSCSGTRPVDGGLI
jgi:pullulanase